MPSLHALAALAIIAVTLALPRVVAARTRRLARLANRAEWGRPVVRDRDVAAVRRYHELRPAGACTSALDARAWDDLNLDAVFAHVDRASGAPGQQVLYHWLAAPVQSPAPLRERERLVTAMSERVRAAIRAACEPLAGRGEHALVGLLWAPLPTRPWWALLLLALPLGTAAALVLAVVWPRALLIALALGVAGAVVRAVVRPRVDALTDAARHLRAFCRAARRLARDLGDAPGLSPEAEALRAHAPALRRIERASTWIAFSTADDDTAMGVAGFAYVVLSLDVATLYACLGELARRRTALRAVFEAVGALDAAASVASWRAGTAVWTRPVLREGGAIRMIGVRHPLLDTPVANDYVPAPPGALVTGANMAGKSTYVRAVGLAAVLAQTLHTVPADAYAAPFLTVRTSIGRSDDVLAGKSYYLAEAEGVLALLAAARTGGGAGRAHLFLLDELFRGTNAVERVAAGAAVLDDLAASRHGVAHYVLAATHDLELVDLLAGRYAPWHFREEVGPDGLAFDYALRPGPAATRNAIALLAQLGAPNAVVTAALETAAALDARRLTAAGPVAHAAAV